MHNLIFALGIFLFICLVLVHEWGHFIVARRNGVFVEEFGLGFPPKATSKKLKSGMHLSLNWLPLGGFVKMRGEHDSDTTKGSFGAASLGAKSRIMLAGVGMNFLVGIVILTILALMGMPKLLTQDNVGQDQFTVASDTKVVQQQLLAGQIIKGSPADKIGLKGTDTILKVQTGNKTYDIKTLAQLHTATQAFAGKTVEITYREGIKNGATVTKSVKLLDYNGIISDLKSQAGLKPNDRVTKAFDMTFKNKNDPNASYTINNNKDFYDAAIYYAGDHVKLTIVNNGQTAIKTVILNPKAYLGVAPNQIQIQRSTWSAPVVALGLTKQIVVLTFVGLGHAISGLGSTIAGGVTGNHDARVNGQVQASSQVGGPVAIGVALWDYGNLGLNFMLFLIALISLTLALMNILPIPALDGGRLFMMWFSRGILKRPFTPAMEEKIVGASFAVLIGLIVLITVVDVKRFF